MMDSWWEPVSGGELAQGDILEKCPLPMFSNDWDLAGGAVTGELVRERMIVMSQTCDLVNAKLRLVALCPVHSLREWEAVNPSFATKNAREAIRQGRREGLHMLASFDSTRDREPFVVDFGHIVSVPFSLLVTHAASPASRPRLRSPYLEHFSQAFARFFIRVGLPSTIPPFK